MEIRIYYECLEQGNDYIKPWIEALTKKHNFKIKLVKRPRKPSQLPHGSIYAIQSLTTPDILITGIIKSKEYPLVLIEFTEAVTTEDHELQRTYGAVSAYLANMLYVKVSGDKSSEKIFGGAFYNPYSTPKILRETFNYRGFIIADWITDSKDKFNLKRSADLPGCPPKIPILKDAIQAAVYGFIKHGENWFTQALIEFEKKASFKKFEKKVSLAAGSEKLLSTWKERGERNSNKNKLRYFVNKNWIGAKINRFSHAMDPDRGILTFISFVFSDSFSIYGIYALVRPRGGDILKENMTSLSKLKSKLKEALSKDEGGIPKWFSAELTKVINQAKTLNDVIDFQTVWEKHFSKITDNKVVLTIAFFLDSLLLNHNGIRLKWDRKKLLGNKEGNIIELLKTFFGFSTYTSPPKIKLVKTTVDEDEVTYAIAHRVLIPNNFRIVSISYPGSQGGGAILPDPSLGKAQPREYPDIIALPPFGHKNNDVILNESKGMFNQGSVAKDTEKILRYKSENKLQSALRESLLVANVLDPNDKLHQILIGVSFGINNTTTTWRPANVDFIFRIVDRKAWAIGIFDQNLKELIPVINGETNFPEVYTINNNLTETLFE